MRSKRVPRVPDAFELLIAWLCVGSGLPLALGAPPPQSIQRTLPSWLIPWWGGTLFLGGLLIVVGVALRHRKPSVGRLLAGLRIEQAGLVPMAAGAVVFAMVIAAVGGWRGAFGAGTYAVFSAACLLRVVVAKDEERGVITAIRRAREQL